MFANTITITRNAVAYVLSRIKDDGYSSEYFFRDTTQELRLNFRHSYDKADPKTGVVMERHYWSLQRTTIVVAPAQPVKEVFSGTVLTQKGADPVSSQLTSMAGLAWATSANVTSLIGFES